MPRSTQAAPGSFRFSGRISTSASASSQRPVSKSSWPRALCACASRIAVPTWSARSRACPAAAKCLLVPVEIAQRDGLVDLQQQPQVGQGRIGLGHGQRPVEQRQRVGHAPLHRGHQRQHVQRPAHGPVVARLRRRRQRAGGDLARLLDLAEVAVRPRGEHEQPGAVPGRDPGRGQRPVQRGQGLRGQPASIRHCASVQCRSTSRSGSAACSSARFATRSASARSPMR